MMLKDGKTISFALPHYMEIYIDPMNNQEFILLQIL
jgi:hypothetical protein